MDENRSRNGGVLLITSCEHYFSVGSTAKVGESALFTKE